MKKLLQQVIDSWPILVMAGVIMVALLTVYAKGFVGDVVEHDLATTPVIIAIDAKIAANTENIEDHDDDVERLANKIDSLEAKIDRLIEIMLTE